MPPSGAGGYYEDVNTITRTGWRAYLPAAVRFILALILLVVLDAFWMGLLAPLLGVKYFDIVEAIQAGFQTYVTNEIMAVKQVSIRERGWRVAGLENKIMSLKLL